MPTILNRVDTVISGVGSASPVVQPVNVNFFEFKLRRVRATVDPAEDPRAAFPTGQPGGTLQDISFFLQEGSDAGGSPLGGAIGQSFPFSRRFDNAFPQSTYDSGWISVDVFIARAIPPAVQQFMQWSGQTRFGNADGTMVITMVVEPHTQPEQ